jgi:predicted small lipoprotein YifL
MRIFLAMVIVLSFAACGKKKPPQSPGGAAEPMTESGAEAERNVNSPDDADDAQDMRSSDPEEGGE